MPADQAAQPADQPTSRWTNLRIRELRIALGSNGEGISQQRFAELVGVSIGTISKWERGKQKPQSEAHRRRLAELEDGARIPR